MEEIIQFLNTGIVHLLAGLVLIIFNKPIAYNTLFARKKRMERILNKKIKTDEKDLFRSRIVVIAIGVLFLIMFIL